MNLQEQVYRIQSMMGIISESLDVTDIDYDDVLFDYHKKQNLQYHSKNGNDKNLDDFKKHFIDEIKKYIFEDNKILLYRVIAVNDESQIRKPFGIYWSFKKEDSQVINWEEIDDPENLNVYRITALFDIKDIDLKNSFELYLINDFMESEIRIKKGVMPQDYFIEKI